MSDAPEDDLDAEALQDRLTAIEEAMGALATISEDVTRLRQTGLDDEDVVALLFGRNRELTKGSIRAVLDGVDDVGDRAGAGPADREELLVRLVSDLTDATMSETRTVLDELDRLGRKYNDD